MSESHTLLVVDDNESNRDLLSRRLAKRGYTVLLANDGTQALKTVAERPVDLILLDIMMPGINGLDVLRVVRQTYTNAELPVIMVTAKSTSEDVVGALEMGANDYVTKPLDFPVVLARVEAQLRQLSATRSRAAAAAAAQPREEEPAPGRTVGGRYLLESIIGSGAFGTVYRARQTDLDRPVAVKVLQNHAVRKPELLQRFQREGIAACRIRHPNAVAVLDFGVSASAAYLVMELLEGHSLETELQGTPRIPLMRALEILRPICGVLAEVHALGIVHRDVKPANVFLHRTSRGELVKVLDFGIAKFVGDAQSSSLTQEGGIVGTPAYMAPERFRGGAPDGRWDVYSLGVMAFQMLGGQLPYPNANTSDLLAVALMHLNDVPPALGPLNPEVTPAVEAVIRQTLDKDPARRPGARELYQRLAAAVGLSADRSSIYIQADGAALPAQGPGGAEISGPSSDTWVKPQLEPAEPSTEVDDDASVLRELPTHASGEPVPGKGRPGSGS